jgi:hypothetical protein
MIASFGPWRRRGRQFAVAAAALCAGVLLFSSHANAAGGAYAVEDAEVEKPGECKVETWLSAAANRDRIGVVSAGCVFDLGRPVELNPQIQRARSGGIWGTDFTFQAKTNILPVETGKLGLALQGGPSFDLVSGDIAGGFIIVPATYQFSEQFKINLNAGWLYEREPHWHWLTWGAGFEWKFAEKSPFTLIGEVFGQVGHHDPLQPRLDDPRAQVGLRYTPVESIDFDVIYGRNITGEDSNWITVGINWRFKVADGEEKKESSPLPRLVRK